MTIIWVLKVKLFFRLDHLCNAYILEQRFPTFLILWARPIYNNLHGPIQWVSSFQNKLLLVMNNVTVSTPIEQYHPMERFRCTDMWEINLFRYCRWDRIQFNSTLKISYSFMTPKKYPPLGTHALEHIKSYYMIFTRSVWTFFVYWFVEDNISAS